MSLLTTLLIVAALLGLAAPSAAQTIAVSSPDGRRQMMAVPTSTPITVDGRLDEAVWATADAARGFIQSDPLEGQPATEDTEVRVAFDADNLYIGVLCHDADPAGIVVNEIRKDFAGREQDTFEVLLDTFADRRNGFVFGTNSQGARADTQIANEGRDVNTNWDAVWWVRSQVLDRGWSAEFRIPFKTLRFQPGDGRLWGINFSRRIRRKNEISYWSPVSRAFSIYRASANGNLGGLPNLRQGRNLRIKPYLLGSAVRGLGESSYAGDASAGLDVKVGIKSSLTLDVTVNPDFAQAEADEQQVNLTQFSQFYPEKREFFLENAGTFYFGDIPRNQRQASRFRPPEEDLLLFFSRRIGLSSEGEQQPLYGGARLTGRAGKVGLGLMTMQSQEHDGTPANNYTVARIRTDVFRSSDIGAIVLSRQAAGTSDDFNRVAGIDANFRFFRNFSVNGFAARSDTPGETRNSGTAKGSVGWEDSSRRFAYSLMTIGAGFRDDMGFVRRAGVTRHFVDGAYYARPAWLRRRGFRQAQPHTRMFRYYNPAGDLVSSQTHFGVQMMWENGATVEYAIEPRVEAIAVPFRIRPAVPIPAGRYDWNQHLIVLETDHSRALSGSMRATIGDFWSGTQRVWQTSLLYRPTYRLEFDLGLQVTDVSLRVPAASFVTTLATLRTGYAFNTNLFFDSLLQYRNDVRQFSANVRLNLIHRPLSDFFIVYNEQQFTDDRQVAAGRGLVVKYTQLFSF